MTNKEKFNSYCKRLNIKPYDMLWLDGYFIFDMGNDTVVHFRIKGVKGFYFGIWFEENKDEFFYQAEIYMDKFKPSRSTSFELKHNQDNDKVFSKIMYNLVQMVQMPYRAIYNDCNYGNIENLYDLSRWKAHKELIHDQLKNIKKNLFGEVYVECDYDSSLLTEPDGNPFFGKCLYLLFKYRHKKIQWNYVFLK